MALIQQQSDLYYTILLLKIGKKWNKQIVFWNWYVVWVLITIQTYDMKHTSSKAAVVIALQDRGYDRDFVFSPRRLRCVQDSQVLDPRDVEIDETYRVEATVFGAIRSVYNNLKGILIVPYGRFINQLA